MSLSNGGWTWTSVLLLRPISDAWQRTRGSRRGGVLLVRDLDSPPGDSVDDFGSHIPGGWRPGVVSSELPGLVGALTTLLGPRQGIYAYVATVDGSDLALWRSRLVEASEQVSSARQEWLLPELVVLGRDHDEDLDTLALSLWPRTVFLPLSSDPPVLDDPDSVRSFRSKGRRLGLGLGLLDQIQHASSSRGDLSTKRPLAHDAEPDADLPGLDRGVLGVERQPLPRPS